MKLKKNLKKKNKKLISNFGKLLSKNWYWKKNNQNVSYHEVDNVYNLGIKMELTVVSFLWCGYFFFN